MQLYYPLQTTVICMWCSYCWYLSITFVLVSNKKSRDDLTVDLSRSDVYRIVKQYKYHPYQEQLHYLMLTNRRRFDKVQENVLLKKCYYYAFPVKQVCEQTPMKIISALYISNDLMTFLQK